MTLITVTVPMRTASALNSREHYMARARRVKAEREMIGWSLKSHAKPKPPLVVTLTRVAPSNGVDEFDNLPSCLKGSVDAIADWLGIDDKDPRVKYRCDQRRGPWSVEIRIERATQ